MTPKKAVETTRSLVQTASPRAADPVEASHFLFIGKPIAYEPLDCEIFESPEAPHRQPPRSMNDATDFPERLEVLINLVEAVQNPSDITPYVDRGNAQLDPWRESWGSLGTDPGKANAGFGTLEEAKAYAATLLPGAP